MKVLVVEDDYITREAIHNCLMSDGYSVVLAECGISGLEEWKTGKFDLICLDIMMPNMSGYEVCRKIRETDQFVSILFLSAKREEIDVVLGLEMGADDFVGKPFGKHEFLARVKSAIRRSKQNTMTDSGKEEIRFVIGDLTVHTEELCAYRGESQLIELTPREVSILKLLYVNKGRPVKRDTFLDVCWGVDYEYSRTLDTHIANLRKKIELNPSCPSLIATVRGVGYRYG